MRRPGRHVESRWHKDQAGPLKDHSSGQLRKPEVKTDTQAYLPELRIKHRAGIPRCQRLRLPEVLSALHLDVKHVDLSVFCDLTAVSVKHISRVVDLARLISLRHGSGCQVDAVLSGQAAQSAPHRATLILRIGREQAGLVRTAEHLPA